MRIISINSVYGRGSTGRIVADIHQSLLERGDTSIVGYGRNTIAPDGASIRIGSNLDVVWHVFETRVLDNHGFASRRATTDFMKVFDSFHPDIIHLHNLHGYYIDVEQLFLALKQSKLRIVWTLHDCWPLTGHCAHFIHAQCQKWRDGCFACPEKRSYPSSYLLDSSARNYERKRVLFQSLERLTIVTPSRWLADIVKQSFLKEYSVRVIPNGIDLQRFRRVKGPFRERYGLQHKYIILGVANIWSERKGLNYFFELSRRLEDDEHIVLIGQIRQNLSRTGFEQKITYISHTDSIDELAEVYSSSDVFLNPTLEDNYPTTTLEALACGTPVIAFNTGGVAEGLAHGSGKLVYEQSVTALRSAVTEMRNKPAEWHANLAAMDRQTATQSYLKLYDEIMAQ